MGHPLRGTFLKLHRATLHREELERQIIEFFRHEPDRVVASHDDQGGPIAVVRGDPIPPHWSAIAGDCLQNLRSALDHAIWACALANGPISDALARHISFRITQDEPSWSRYAKGKTGKANRSAIGADAWQVLREMQPYKRQNVNVNADPLWALNELARIDRHQTLHLAVVMPHGTFVGFGAFQKTGNVALMPFGWPGPRYRLVAKPVLNDGSVKLTPPSPDVTTYSYATFEFAFDPNGPFAQGVPLIDTLEAIEEAVRAVIVPAFDPIFP